MKRIKRKQAEKADAILTADLHLTDHQPVSRTDDFITAQENKLSFLTRLSDINNGCPIICAGDVFHRWKASPWLCSFAFENLPEPFFTIPGNHDLPEHSLEYYDKSALSLMNAIDRVIVMRPGMVFTNKFIVIGIPFGELEKFDPEDESYINNMAKYATPKLDYNTDVVYNTLWPLQWANLRKILVLHELVWPGDRPSWAVGSYTDEELLERFGPYFDLIVTGDNHAGFDSRLDSTILVNPGSMLRLTADQADYEPRCYLWFAEENRVEAVIYPVERGVHTREHIDKKLERENRIAAYIEKMSGEWDVSLSFERNLRAFFAANKTPKKVRELIWEHMDRPA